MKLKSVALMTALGIIATTSAANANLLFDPYIGATAGVGGATLFADHDNKSYVAQSYGAVAGLDLPLLRIEAEYNYLNDDVIKAQLGMVNGYLKMPTPMFQPYIGAGVGAVMDGDIDNGPDIEKTAAYQGMLGLTFNIPVLPFKIDGEARALYAPKIAKLPGDDIDLLHYDVRVKLRFIF